MAAEICAFANSEGGFILVGVRDDGSIEGLNPEEVRVLNQQVSNVCSQKIDPPIAAITENILCGEKIVVAIRVPRGTKNDEAVVEQTGINDLDLRSFETVFEKRTGIRLSDSEIPIGTILENLKVLKEEKCTLAGLLLFGKKPENKCHNLVMKAVSFYGNDPAGIQYRDSRDLAGDIAQLFTGGMFFLKNNLRMPQNSQNFYSIGILEIPEVALEEALINAILHRDYFISSHIRLFIFDDRVEIISPGTLSNTVTVESIKLGIHIERNPILASLVKDIQGIPYRGIGTGMRRILKSCKEAGVAVELV